MGQLADRGSWGAVNSVGGICYWLVVWNMNGLFFHIYIYWECHHPNWLINIFQRGGLKPPTRWVVLVVNVLLNFRRIQTYQTWDGSTLGSRKLRDTLRSQQVKIPKDVGKPLNPWFPVRIWWSTNDNGVPQLGQHQMIPSDTPWYPQSSSIFDWDFPYV